MAPAESAFPSLSLHAAAAVKQLWTQKVTPHLSVLTRLPRIPDAAQVKNRVTLKEKRKKNVRVGVHESHPTQGVCRP